MTQPNIYDLLEQDEVWYGKVDGVLTRIPLAEMDSQYRANLAAWLRRQAPGMVDGAVRGMQYTASRMQGEYAVLEMDKAADDLADRDPLDWLREQPLYRALTTTPPRRVRTTTYVPPPPDPLDEETRPPEDDDPGWEPGYEGHGYWGKD